MNAYEEKQQARRDYYLARAVAASRASNSAMKSAEQMASRIPFGQPVHASERGYRGRIDSTIRRAVSLDNKAQYYADKAAAVGKGGISSDDPDAVQKLQEKLAKLIEKQALMKKVNTLISNNDIEGIKTLGLSENEFNTVTTPDHRGRAGYREFELINMSANIRSVKKRIAALESAQTFDFPTIEGDGWRCSLDKDENRFVFDFDSIPPEEKRDLLKRNAFKWSRVRKAWVRKFAGNASLFAAKRIIAALQEESHA